MIYSDQQREALPLSWGCCEGGHIKSARHPWQCVLQSSCQKPADPALIIRWLVPKAQTKVQVHKMPTLDGLPGFCIQLEFQLDLWQIHTSLNSIKPFRM